MKTFLYSTRFKKNLKKLDKKIIKAFKTRFVIFQENEYASILNNHPLKAEFADCKSINITGDYRLVYKRTDNLYIFLDIGTHSQLYD
ncbi:type II toxin-antitoxin system mRNA interferase toxin, RelE/StbE family [Arenimonas sp.]|nr:type II toxin-antitoxin system mRNA interferase toxin, RelE/StbE family [Candidatus Parcubacteria bacterium]